MENKSYLSEGPVDDFGFIFWQLTKSWQRSKQKQLDQYGITVPQFEVLSAAYYLSTTEEEVTQIIISNCINIDRMTVSTILRNLETKGLVKRYPSRIDARAMRVQLTEDGKIILDEAMTKIRMSTDDLMKSIDQDLLKREFKILLKILGETNN